jgi:hypothetical protein
MMTRILEKERKEKMERKDMGRIKASLTKEVKVKANLATTLAVNCRLNNNNKTMVKEKAFMSPMEMQMVASFKMKRRKKDIKQICGNHGMKIHGMERMISGMNKIGISRIGRAAMIKLLKRLLINHTL